MPDTDDDFEKYFITCPACSDSFNHLTDGLCDRCRKEARKPCASCGGKVAVLEARIRDLDRKLDQAIDLLDFKGKASLFAKFAGDDRC